MDQLAKARCTAHFIFAQNSQERTECTKSKEIRNKHQGSLQILTSYL